MPKQFYDRTLFSPHLYSNNTVVRTAHIFVTQLNIEQNARLLCFCTSNWILCRNHAAHIWNGFYLEHNHNSNDNQKYNLPQQYRICWTLNHLLRLFCIWCWKLKCQYMMMDRKAHFVNFQCSIMRFVYNSTS